MTFIITCKVQDIIHHYDSFYNVRMSAGPGHPVIQVTFCLGQLLYKYPGLTLIDCTIRVFQSFGAAVKSRATIIIFQIYTNFQWSLIAVGLIGTA